MLTVVTETKTFTVLANQRDLLVSGNAEKNLKSNGKNNSIHCQLCGDFSEIRLVSIVAFVRKMTRSPAMVQIIDNYKKNRLP